MDRTELSKAQIAICDALGLDAKRLTKLEVHMGIDSLWFRASGYAYGSDQRPFVVRDGNDTGPATFSITNMPASAFFDDPTTGQVVRLMVDGLRGEFPSIEAALQALPTMGDELRAAAGIRAGRRLS